MKLNYVNKIRANISIYSRIRSNNLLDGTYKSIHKGKSMNFEDLREYVINDDIKDIDWKSSARSRTLLVKRYVAEKKHNIMLVMDTSKNMEADTDKHENKKKLALYTAGTIGYLAIRNGDYISMAYEEEGKIQYRPFRYNLYNLENYLYEYDKCKYCDNYDLNSELDYLFKNITRRMIIFVITDLNGVNGLQSRTLKRLAQKHDVLAVIVNDNFMTGADVYNVESDSYLPDFILKNKKLHKSEVETRRSLIEKNMDKLKRHKITSASVSSLDQINYRVISLLSNHKNAGRN